VNHQKIWLRSIMLIMLCAVVLLSACESNSQDANVAVGDGLGDGDGNIDPTLYTGDVELQTEKLEIWWDESFGAPYKEFMGEHLEQAFGKDRFEVLNFRRPYSITNSYEGDLFYELRERPTPDLIVFDSRLLPFFVESNYLEPIDIESFLELKSDVLDEIREVVPDRQLYALPYGENVAALYYNKSIFDGLDVPYPTDGMTWDEVLELAAEVKSPGSWVSLDVEVDYGLIASQIALHLYDQEKQLVDLETEAWKEWIRFTEKYLDHRKGEVMSRGMSAFSAGKTAMIVGSQFEEFIDGLYVKEQQFRIFEVEWDVVSFPVFDREDPVAPAKQRLMIGVPRMAAHKEDAYKLIQFLLSEAVQFENLRRGLISLRADADDRMDEFGVSSPLWVGKSRSFLKLTTPAGSYDPSLDKYNVGHLRSGGYSPNDATDWRTEWDPDVIREYVTDYLNKRTAMITELQEKVSEYERFNQ